jgi:hypothetical protein
MLEVTTKIPQFCPNIKIADTIAWEKGEGRQLTLVEAYTNPLNRKRLIIATSFSAMVMLPGKNIITYYLGTMLEQAGIKDATTQLEVNIILTAGRWSLLSSPPILPIVLDERLSAVYHLAVVSSHCTYLAGSQQPLVPQPTSPVSTPQSRQYSPITEPTILASHPSPSCSHQKSSHTAFGRREWGFIHSRRSRVDYLCPRSFLSHSMLSDGKLT